MMYLDSDTTPPIASRYLHSTTKVETAKRRAFSLLAEVAEGQIGIYENQLGMGFKGYAIKYPGEEPYFEAATGGRCPDASS